MDYKKMFSIEFNQKEFMLFLGEDGRITFLQMEDNQFKYPFLNDYLALYKIFNLQSPYLFAPVYHFDDFVRFMKKGTVTLLSLAIFFSNVPTALANDIHVDVENNGQIVVVPVMSSKDESDESSKKKSVLITDVADLDKYLGKVEVTRDLIVDACNKNQKLPKEIRDIALGEYDKIHTKHPDANYRVFYENMKTLNVNIYSEAEYNKLFPTGSEANYDFMVNAINIKEGASKFIIAHELAHTYYSIFRVVGNVYIVRRDRNTALHEGMTDKMAKWYTTSSGGSYDTSEKILDYLMYLTGFTFEEFSRFGIDRLLSLCKSQYPEVDFEYISKTLNASVASRIFKLKGNKKLDGLYDELFMACLKKASKANGYEPFNKFLLTNVNTTTSLTDYYNRYTLQLKSLGYDANKIKAVQDNFKNFEKANCIVYDPADISSIAFGYQAEDYKIYRVESNGKLSLLNQDDYKYQRYTPPNFDLIRMRALTNEEKLTDSLASTLKEDGRLSPHCFSLIPINNDGKLIANTFTGNLFIQVGFTKNKEVGFVISNQDGSLFFSTKEGLGNLSNKVDLNSYLAQCDYVDSLELGDVLCEDYLKNVQASGNLFNNIDVKEGSIVASLSKMVTIVSEVYGKELQEHFKLNDCKVYVTQYGVFAYASNQSAFDYDYVIDLKNLLEWSGILKDDVDFYTLSNEELGALANEYLASVKQVRG